jgi:hypothetical protein
MNPAINAVMTYGYQPECVLTGNREANRADQALDKFQIFAP